MPAVFMSPVARPGLGLNIRSNIEPTITPKRKALLLASSTPRRAQPEEKEVSDADVNENDERDEEAEELQKLVNSDDEPLKLTDDEKVSFQNHTLVIQYLGNEEMEKSKASSDQWKTFHLKQAKYKLSNIKNILICSRSGIYR